MPKLVVKKKAEVLLEYYIQKAKIVIGSADESDICLKDPQVSTQHCELVKEEDKTSVNDMHSAYGTFVNDEKVDSREIELGDEIGVGPYRLVLRPTTGKKDDVGYDLLGISGPFLGKKYELLGKETKIGRSEEYNEIFLPGSVDASVSRRHATVTVDEGEYVLTDKRSRNRTFVNKHQVGEEEAITLKPKDEILIGHSIFRFVKIGEDDFSPPKRAGMIWIRLWYPALKAVSAVLLFLSLLYGSKGFKGLSVINSRPVGFSIYPLAWSFSLNPEDILAEGFLEFDYDLSPTPGIGDLNNDSVNDVALLTTTGRIYAWDGKSGQRLWNPIRIGSNIVSSLVLADMNQDGISDIIVCSDESKLYIIDGPTGKIAYKSEILGGMLTPSPAVCDFNSDGLLDVVVCSEEGYVYLIFSPVSGPDIKSLELVGSVYSSPVINYRQGNPIVVIGTSEGKLYLINSTGAKDSIDVTENINQRLGVFLPMNEITPTPAIGDANGDGIDDIILVDNQYIVSAFDGATRKLLWKPFQIEPISEKLSPIRYASPVLADFNLDGKMDILVAACNGKILVVDGFTGKLLWEYDTGFNNRLISTPAVADFNKDGIADVVALTEDGNLYILSGLTGLPPDVSRQLVKEKVADIPLTSSPVLGDISGDGYCEILFCPRSNEMSVRTTNTRVFRAELIWPMFHHDMYRTGAFQGMSSKSPFMMKILFSIILIFFVIIIWLIIIKKRDSRRPPVLPHGAKKTKE